MSTALFTPETVIQVLLWMIVVVGAALVGLLMWIGNRLQKKVDEMPEQIKVHVQTTLNAVSDKLDAIGDRMQNIERDLRSDLADLDRRVVRLEALSGQGHLHKRRSDA